MCGDCTTFRGGDRLALTIRKIGRKSEAPAVEGVAPGADGDVDGGDDEDDDETEEEWCWEAVNAFVTSFGAAAAAAKKKKKVKQINDIVLRGGASAVGGGLRPSFARSRISPGSTGAVESLCLAHSYVHPQHSFPSPATAYPTSYSQ